MRRFGLLVIFGLVLQGVGIQLANAAGPDLVLSDLNGKPVPVSKYIGQGKWTLVMLWAHNCPVCNREVDNISFFYDDHKNKGVNVLGVSVDGPSQIAKAQAFVDDHLVDFPNLVIEPAAQQIEKFGGGPFVGTPTFYVYSPEGKLVAKNVGAISIKALNEFLAKQQEEGLARK
jgi:peroxiredoxin